MPVIGAGGLDRLYDLLGHSGTAKHATTFLIEMASHLVECQVYWGKVYCC